VGLDCARRFSQPNIDLIAAWWRKLDTGRIPSAHPRAARQRDDLSDGVPFQHGYSKDILGNHAETGGRLADQVGPGPTMPSTN